MTHSKRATRAGSAAVLATLVLAPTIAHAAEPTDPTQPVLSRGVSTTTLTGGGTSDMFAGYVAGLGDNQKIVGTFKAPTMQCAGQPDSGIMSVVEIGSTDGSAYADGALFSYCDDGVAVHRPVFDASTGQVAINKPVRDDDRIRVAAKVVENRLYVRVDNLNLNWEAYAIFDGIPAEVASSAQYRFSIDGELLPPYDYGTTAVNNVEVGDEKLKSVDPARVDMVIDGETVIRPSKISNGRDFNFRFVG